MRMSIELAAFQTAGPRQPGRRRPSRTERVSRVGALTLGALVTFAPGGAAQEPSPAPASLSLDSLLNIQISAASRYTQVAARAPAFVTIVTSEDIERFGYETLNQVVESLPGFHVSSDRNYSYIGTRGFSRPTDYNNRILVLLNGTPQNETFYNSIYGGRELGLDLRAVDRIEVVRGPASALYGSNAMFAVINIVSKSSGQGGRVTGALGNYGQQELSVTAETGVGGVDLLFGAQSGRSDGGDLHFPEFADSTSQGGVARGLDWERYDGALVTARAGRLSFQARAASRRKGIPTAAWGTAFNDSRSRTRDDWVTSSLSYGRAAGANIAWTLRAHGGHYRYHGWYASDEVYEDENLGLWGGLDGQLTWDPSPGHRLTAGAEVARTGTARYRSTGGYDENFPFRTWSLFLSDELELAPYLTLIGGVRKDGHSESPDAFSPRLGVIAIPSGSTTLKLLWGQGFRAPTVYERDYEVGRFEGSARLDPERIRTTELVWEQRLGPALYLTTSLFDSYVHDLIDTTVDPETGSWSFQNVGNARTSGVEAEAMMRLANGVAAYGRYAFVRAIDETTDERLTNAPRHQLKLGGSLRVPLGTVALEGRYEGSRLTVQDTETDPAFVVNGSFASPPLLGGLALTARVVDLLDSDFQAPGGFEHAMAAIPQGPRSVWFGLSYAW